MTESFGHEAQPRGARPAPAPSSWTVWDLIFYGIVLIMPIAPVPMFGVAQVLSHGHFVTTILIAMIAMMLTAVSYGRMASLFPTAGSAYTYVGRGLNPHLGFLTGWAMFLDYLIQPLMNGVYGAVTIQRFFPFVPYAVLAAIFVATMTLFNLRGISRYRTCQHRSRHHHVYGDCSSLWCWQSVIFFTSKAGMECFPSSLFTTRRLSILG